MDAWELGYFDGLSNGTVAVLPLVDCSSESYRGQEYLGLYPTVDKGRYSDTGAAETFVKKNKAGKHLVNSEKAIQAGMAIATRPKILLGIHIE